MNKNTRSLQNRIAFVAGLAADRVALAATKRTGTVGAACTGRLAAVFQSAAQNLAIKVGENTVLERALIHNGRHPAYQNGRTLLPKYRRQLARLVSQ